jgi:hypothetical protein
VQGSRLCAYRVFVWVKKGGFLRGNPQ